MGKGDVLELKSGNISEMSKDRRKVIMAAYRNSLFRTVSSTTPYGLLFPKIGGSPPQPKSSIAIISGTGKAIDFTFGRYIQSVHLNKSPLKFCRKGSAGVSRDCPNFLSTPYYLRNGKSYTNFQFCTHIHRIDRNKSPLKFRGK